MPGLDVPYHLSLLFVLLSLGVAALDVVLVRLAAPAPARSSWTRRATILAALWLTGHALPVEVMLHML